MVNFFKRSDATAATTATTPALKEPSLHLGERRRFPRPLPTPEVVEGNENSDWDLWEESVSFQDSQLPPATPPLSGLQKQDAIPGKDADITDPFASVHKRSS